MNLHNPQTLICSLGVLREYVLNQLKSAQVGKFVQVQNFFFILFQKRKQAQNESNQQAPATGKPSLESLG